MVTVLGMYSFWISKTVCHFSFGIHTDNGLEKIIYLKRRQLSKDQRRERPQTLGKVFECNVSFLLQSPLGGEAGCSSGTGLPSLDGSGSVRGTQADVSKEVGNTQVLQ